MTSPTHAVLPPTGVNSAHSPRGGHLAPVITQYRGHLLFRQLPHDVGADLPDANEPAASSLPAVFAGAGWPCSVSASPRPSPFPQVDHVAHLETSVADTSEASGSHFA